MTDFEREFVLVRGVVYSRRAGWDGDWHRASMPPDATPGIRSKWPPKYTPSRLPKHEVVGKERAKELIDASLTRLDDLRAEAAR
jgi:hypothetical protein